MTAVGAAKRWRGLLPWLVAALVGGVLAAFVPLPLAAIAAVVTAIPVGLWADYQRPS